MVDLHYEHPKLADIYDLANGWSEDREFYLSLAECPPKRVLDLGCGTGLLCNAFAAEGNVVTGVEPSGAMLEVAKKREHGGSINWVQATAQSFRTDRQFDLIVMTGHAFQVLLEEQDVLETFSMMRRHLAPAGLIAFETRNPLIDWSSIWHGKRIHRESQYGPLMEEFYVHSHNQNRILFETKYIFPSEELVSLSDLRFWKPEEVEVHLLRTGLRAERVLGDWHNAEFSPTTSREIVFLARNQTGGRAPN